MHARKTLYTSRGPRIAINGISLCPSIFTPPQSGPGISPFDKRHAPPPARSGARDPHNSPGGYVALYYRYDKALVRMQRFSSAVSVSGVQQQAAARDAVLAGCSSTCSAVRDDALVPRERSRAIFFSSGKRSRAAVADNIHLGDARARVGPVC